jgi:hypothetical protein
VEAYSRLAPAMVHFDPTVNFHPGERLVNDAEQSLILAARRIVRGLGCCVRYVHHVGKANAREKTLDQYSARGGSALPDGARMVAVLRPWDTEDKLEPPPGFVLATGETGLILARAKGSYHPLQPYIWLKRNGYAFEWVMDTPRDPHLLRSAYADQVERFLVAELKLDPPHPHTRNSLEHADIMPREALRRAVSDLEIENRIIDTPLPPHLLRGRRKTYLRPASQLAAGSGEIDLPDDARRTHPIISPPYREERNGEITLSSSSYLADPAGKLRRNGELTAHLVKFLTDQRQSGRRYGKKELAEVAPALGMSRKDLRDALARAFLDGSIEAKPWPEGGRGKEYLQPRAPVAPAGGVAEKPGDGQPAESTSTTDTASEEAP